MGELTFILFTLATEIFLWVLLLPCKSLFFLPKLLYSLAQASGLMGGKKYVDWIIFWIAKFLSNDFKKKLNFIAESQKMFISCQYRKTMTRWTKLVEHRIQKLRLLLRPVCLQFARHAAEEWEKC